MNGSHAKWMVNGGLAARALLAGVLLLVTFVGAGCSLFRPSPPCVNIEATAAYYYRYKDATPDLSDIAFIEVVPPGPRCIIGSAKPAPVFPDKPGIGAAVGSGAMKIDLSDGTNKQIQGNASIAVYYKGTSHVPVAVENLSGISRVIETAGIVDPGLGGGSCGTCRSYPCGGYTCCKCP